MNSKIVLVALAAFCCVQGIAAAGIARPLPFVERPAAVADFENIDLDSLDVDAILHGLTLTLEQFTSEIDEGLELNTYSTQTAKEGRALKNVFGCVIAITNAFKQVVSIKNLIEEFNDLKKELKNQKAMCNAAEPADAAEVAACEKVAQDAYDLGLKQAKAKITPTIFKTFTSVFALKSCLSIF